MQGLSGKAPLVSITYRQLLKKDSSVLEIIDKAYSKNGLGTLVIEDVPQFKEKRNNVLQKAWQLANLPREALKKLERPEHFYQVGWEHGQYGFLEQRDVLMGSFFFNPLQDRFVGEDGKFWENAWPQELPDLKPDLVELSLIMKDVTVLVASQIDYLLQEKGFPMKNFFQETISNSTKIQGRLIHYYPLTETFQGHWTGWHKDIGLLTCLASALYTDKHGQPIDFGGSTFGLFGQQKNGEIVKLSIPKGNLAVQIGETTEIITGGEIKALPHAVLSSGGNKEVSRNTLALFYDPVPDFPLNLPDKYDEKLFVDNGLTPTLRGRLEKGDTYGDFYIRSLNNFKRM